MILKEDSITRLVYDWSNPLETTGQTHPAHHWEAGDLYLTFSCH
jgi:hypothetical protein